MMQLNLKRKPYPANLEVISLAECDSTNSYLRRNYDQLKDKLPVLVTSGLQTAGRGREQRTWLSSRGKGLYSSFGFNLAARQYLNMLPLIAGFSVIETLQAASGIPNLELGIKWPNDVLCQGKKIAGILIENIIMETRLFCITGIGINLNHSMEDFPLELNQKAISLKMAAATTIDYTVQEVNPLLSRFLFQWLEKLETGQQEEIIRTANLCSHFLMDKTISFHHF
jgi:BirA family transcriptional regulator, biotin operon repressor / biotin---[acetyl-CoA-carboxylase] ligase